ncbi:MAG: DegT/DnrJ/EryC1/StrS family aminotransferase [Planctomycetia bacterium]|nr:MAG: DegT/DnrJ/EryC1/StrS family aminotransferase [Planctomycetia bacterium]
MSATASAAPAAPASVTVPPLNLPAAYAELREELSAELLAVAASGMYVMGAKVTAFEDALRAYCGCKHALGVSSGTDALLVAMMALNIGPGDEVIVPTFTFFGTAGTVSRLGATPVFVDVEPDTYNVNVAQLAAKITPRTKAVIPVHLYGQLADMDALLAVARPRGIPVIEDACQAIGATERADGGRMAGCFGEFASLSFYPTKNLGAMGDAGALLCNDDALHETARLLRTHGENPRYYHRLIGGNFRLDAIQAAVLTIKLRRLEAWTAARRERAATYTHLFVEARLAPEVIRTPVERRGRHTYHQYVIRAPRRDELTKHLTARGIGWGVYYPLPLHRQDCFANLGYQAGQFPVAEQAALEVLALPMYPELTEVQQRAVVEAIRAFYHA